MSKFSKFLNPATGTIQQKSTMGVPMLTHFHEKDSQKPIHS